MWHNSIYVRNYDCLDLKETLKQPACDCLVAHLQNASSSQIQKNLRNDTTTRGRARRTVTLTLLFSLKRTISGHLRKYSQTETKLKGVWGWITPNLQKLILQGKNGSAKCFCRASYGTRDHLLSDIPKNMLKLCPCSQREKSVNSVSLTGCPAEYMTAWYTPFPLYLCCIWNKADGTSYFLTYKQCATCKLEHKNFIKELCVKS